MEAEVEVEMPPVANPWRDETEEERDIWRWLRAVNRVLAQQLEEQQDLEADPPWTTCNIPEIIIDVNQ